jgi:hypothetical protein
MSNWKDEKEVNHVKKETTEENGTERDFPKQV